MRFVETWLVELPPLAVYAVVGLVIGRQFPRHFGPEHLAKAERIATTVYLKRRTRRELALAELDS